MRFMVWYLGFGLHVAAIIALRDGHTGAEMVVGVSLGTWFVFGVGLLIAAAVRRMGQASQKRFTPREVANLTKKVGE